MGIIADARNRPAAPEPPWGNIETSGFRYFDELQFFWGCGAQSVWAFTDGT
jgi:hypothetical protein